MYNIIIMKTVVYSSQSWNVTNSKSIYQHIDFIPGQIDLFTSHEIKFSFSTDRNIGHIENRIIEDYLDTYQSVDVWRHYYDKIDVSDFKQYDNIYVIAPPVYALYSLTDEKFKKFHEDFSDLLDSKRDLRFNSHGLPLLEMMVLAKASREYKIPFFQYNFEVTGIDLSKIKGLEPYQYQMFHGYKYRDLDYATTLQHYYVTEENKKMDDFFADTTEIKKTSDFAFCYYLFEKQRQEHRVIATDDLKEKILPKFDENKMFFYEYNKEDPKAKTIPRDDYLNRVAHARFSYIIPSFQKDVFSIDRFVDCIANNCVPLIHPTVYTDDVEKTYNVDLSQLKTFEIPTEEKRLEILSYLKDKVLYAEKLPNLRG